MIRRTAGPALASALAFGAVGCTAVDNFLASIDVFSFMHEAPSVDPYEMTRPAPALSIPFESPAGEYVPSFAPGVAGLDSLAAAVTPPAGYAEAELERGQTLYLRQCMVCHGPTGLGDGPIVAPGKFPLAPNLTLPLTVGRSDGYLYAVIRRGRGLMPPYGERLSHMERWYVVGYVRQLQRAAAAGGEN